MPLESTINTNAVKRLNKLPRTWAKKFHGSGYGHPELDVYGCSEGYAFFLEGKQPGKKPTPRQMSIIRKWEKTGAITGVYHTADEAVEIVRAGVLSKKKKDAC